MLKQTVCELYVGGQDMPFGKITKVNKALKEMDNKIIECTVDKMGQFVFMRERTDKSFPNGFTTAKGKKRGFEKP